MEDSSETVPKEEVKRQTWTLEPALFLLFGGYYLSISVVTNQILKQTCLYTFEYNETICMRLSNNSDPELEKELQPSAAKILMTVSILSYSVSSILCLFLGPWSDRFGRKKVLNLLYLGYAISMASFMVISYMSDYERVNNPWNYLFAQIPFMVAGGWPTVIVVHLCYIADQTTLSNRSFRITILQVTIFGGRLIGNAASSYILAWTNATTVFFISFGCVFIGFMVVVFFAEETIKEENRISLWQQYKELFKPVRVKELLMTFIQKRDFKQRRILWSIIVILMLINFTATGTLTVFYLFTRNKFGWSLKDETLYESATMIMTMIGGFFGIMVFKKFSFSDLSIAKIAIISLLIDGFVKAFATDGWQLYLASVITLLKMVYGPTLKAILPGIVSKTEIGASYSVTQAIETISGFASAPVYAATYSATLATFPAAFNLVTTLMITAALILSLFIAMWMKSRDDNGDDGEKKSAEMTVEFKNTSQLSVTQDN